MSRFIIGLYISLAGLTATSFSQIPSHDELLRRLKLNQSLYEQWDFGESLISREDRTGSDVLKAPKAIEDIMQCTICVQPDLNNHGAIKSATLLSDITVIGHVVQGMCAMTKRGAFLYTDSELVIDEVLFQKPASATRPSVHERDEITVTEPGGKIKRGEHTIEVQAAGRKRLLKDRTYLLFLRYLPGSNSYKAIGLDGYDISDQSVIPLRTTADPLSEKDLEDRSTFLTGVRHSVINAQGGDGK